MNRAQSGPHCGSLGDYLRRVLILQLCFGAIAAGLAFFATGSFAAVPPSDSLHRLSFPLTDQRGQRFTLAEERRPATVVSMFYGDCHSACPIAIETTKRMVETVPAARRKNLRVLLISLNPGTDTPEMLGHLVMRHELDPQVFRFGIPADESHTRQIAATLGIKYRRLPDGEINHSTRFVLLDADGRIVKTSDRLGVEPETDFLEAIDKAVGR
ncbi:SCO family protein [Niveibacterium sp. SC-1]|uniref:SCO family protein n=1 Tax=Niveibacterium sp. SC-1 TaxID=3135646 RepID=UPI00311D80FF